MDSAIEDVATDSQQIMTNEENNVTKKLRSLDGDEVAEPQAKLAEAESDSRHLSTNTEEEEPSSEATTSKQANTETNEAPPAAESFQKPTFSSILEFVESEIWARDESKWKYPTLGGFAQDAVDMGLSNDVKQAKKDIRSAFETGNFSATRVISRYLSQQQMTPDSTSMDEVAKKLQAEFGGGVTDQVVRETLHKILYPDASEEESTSESDSSDDEEQLNEPNEPEVDDTTRLAISQLTTTQRLRMAAKAASLDILKVPSLAKIPHETVLNAIEKLIEVDERGIKDSREAKRAYAAVEKSIRQLIPLTYKPSENVSKTCKDLLDLAVIVFESKLQLPRGLTCTPTGDLDTYRVMHPEAHRRIGYFASSAQQFTYAWYSPCKSGAAYAMCKGYPFPGLDKSFTLTGKRRKDAYAWILFRIAVRPEHATFEIVDAVEDDAEQPESVGIELDGELLSSNTIVHVFEAYAVEPVLLKVAVRS